jgi:hypothetical protein
VKNPLLSLLQRLAGPVPPEPPHYRMALIDPSGNIVKSKLLRVWSDNDLAAEYSAMQIGKELGRDAIHHAKLPA